MRRLTAWFAGRQFQIDAAKRCEAAANGRSQRFAGGWPTARQRILEDGASLCLHRAAIMGGTDAQLLFQRRIELPNIERGRLARFCLCCHASIVGKAPIGVNSLRVRFDEGAICRIGAPTRSMSIPTET